MSERILVDELSKVYTSMDMFKDAVCNRVAALETKIATLETKIDAMPRHPSYPCDVAQDHAKRLAVLESSVQEHHRLSEYENRMKQGAFWKVAAQVIASAIIAAVAALLAMNGFHFGAR